MRERMLKLWHDEDGSYLLLEWLMVVLFLVIGMVAALSTLRQAVTTEATETANAILALNQSYSFSGNQVHAIVHGNRSKRAQEGRGKTGMAKGRGPETKSKGKRSYAAATGGSAVKDTPGSIRMSKVEAKDVTNIDVEKDDTLD